MKNYTEEIKNIMNYVEKITSEEYYESIKTGSEFFQLKYSAALFLKSYNQYLTLTDRDRRNNLLRADLKHFLQINDSNLLSEVKNSYRSWSDRRLLENMIYLKAFQFDKALTTFRKQAERKIAYVLEDEHHRLKTYIITPEELALTMIGGKVGLELPNFIKNRNDYKKDLEKESSYEKSFSKNNEKHFDQAQKAWLGTRARLERYYNLVGGKKTNGLLLYKDNRQWIKFRVLNYGDVKEAYVAALMMNHQCDYDLLCQENQGSPEYYSDELIQIFAEYYIARVDSLAAIVEEDIKTKDYQFGVKSRGAGLPSIYQYIRMAKYILSSQGELKPDDIEKKLKELYHRYERNKIIDDMEFLLTKNSEKVIEDFYSILKN